MINQAKDAHLTKKSILIKRGIIKEDAAENILYQTYLPRGFTLNLCGHCTYKCSYCPQSLKSHPAEYIKPEIVQKVFNELGDAPVYVQMSSRGENLLHPKFFDFISLIKQKSALSYICLNTNAYIIDNEMMNKLLLSGIDHIVFSLQTINPQLYQTITGSRHYKKIIDRIIAFVKKRKDVGSKTFLSVQYLGFEENLPYRDEFINFWKSIIY